MRYIHNRFLVLLVKGVVKVDGLLRGTSVGRVQIVFGFLCLALRCGEGALFGFRIKAFISTQSILHSRNNITDFFLYITL